MLKPKGNLLTFAFAAWLADPVRSMAAAPNPTVLLDDLGARPRYDASSIAATTAGAGPRSAGAASTASTRESFLIAAVAENRAREIGTEVWLVS